MTAATPSPPIAVVGVAASMPDAPHETLMTVDATTGQNGVRQAKLFGEAVGVTGIILTKLDGTAKGGIALAIALITGADDEKLPKQSRELGIRFLPKPFDVGEVQKILRTYAEEARERHQRRLEQESPDYGPPLAEYADEYAAGDEIALAYENAINEALPIGADLIGDEFYGPAYPDPSRSGSGYGSGRRSTDSTTPNIAVLAPMPSDSVSTQRRGPAGCRRGRAGSGGPFVVWRSAAARACAV